MSEQITIIVFIHYNMIHPISQYRLRRHLTSYNVKSNRMKITSTKNSRQIKIVSPLSNINIRVIQFPGIKSIFWL